MTTLEWDRKMLPNLLFFFRIQTMVTFAEPVIFTFLTVEKWTSKLKNAPHRREIGPKFGLRRQNAPWKPKGTSHARSVYNAVRGENRSPGIRQKTGSVERLYE